MNLLQKLIQAKLAEGKSYRRMEEECGVSHNSLSDYHQRGKIPHHGKNLAILAKYFNVAIDDLLEDVDSAPAKAVPFGAAPEDQLALEAWENLSRDQKLRAVVLLHRLAANKKTPHPQTSRPPRHNSNEE